MPDPMNPEIPEAARKLAEESVRQARSSYEQLFEMTRKAQEVMTGATQTATSQALEMQAKAQRFTEHNMQGAFDFAAALARARDVKEYMEIYQRHAQMQAQTYAMQAQELARLMTDVTKK